MNGCVFYSFPVNNLMLPNSPVARRGTPKKTRDLFKSMFGSKRNNRFYEAVPLLLFFPPNDVNFQRNALNLSMTGGVCLNYGKKDEGTVRNGSEIFGRTMKDRRNVSESDKCKMETEIVYHNPPLWVVIGSIHIEFPRKYNTHLFVDLFNRAVTSPLHHIPSHLKPYTNNRQLLDLWYFSKIVAHLIFSRTKPPSRLPRSFRLKTASADTISSATLAVRFGVVVFVQTNYNHVKHVLVI